MYPSVPFHLNWISVATDLSSSGLKKKINTSDPFSFAIKHEISTVFFLAEKINSIK